MPINFITGLPRSGKTLWTLTQVKALAEKDKRQVYYCNIPKVTIPGWLEIEHPDEWMKLPDGCMIVVDELQDFWGKMPVGAKVPTPILELSKHGKRGIDFYFITQEPELVHTTPRALCQFHYYVIRAFGAGACMIYKFQRMQTRPEKVKAKGEKFPWKYNKEAFNWYKSADVHNIKREIPKKIIAIPFFALLAGAAIWGAVHMFHVVEARAQGKSVTGQPLAAAAAPGSVGTGKGHVQTVAEYLASFQPRVLSVPYSAPRYDDITKPVRAPVPAACVLSATKGCHCFSQQATPLEVADSACRQIVAHGYFQDFDAGPDIDAKTSPSPAVAASAPAPAVAEQQSASFDL